MKLPLEPLFIPLHENGYMVNQKQMWELVKNNTIGRIHIGGVPKTSECRIHSTTPTTITFEDIHCSDVRFTFNISKLNSPLDLYEFVAYDGCHTHYPDFVHHKLFVEDKEVRLNPKVNAGSFIHLEDALLPIIYQKVRHDVLIHNIKDNELQIILEGVWYSHPLEELRKVCIILTHGDSVASVWLQDEDEIDVNLDSLKFYSYQ